MQQMTKDLESMKESDIINLLLFCVFKMTQNPEYAAISELIYVLDKDSLLKLCATYGGTTIRVPKLSELKTVTNAMLVYEYSLDGCNFTEACSALNIDMKERKNLLDVYNLLLEIIAEYEES